MLFAHKIKTGQVNIGTLEAKNNNTFYITLNDSNNNTIIIYTWNENKTNTCPLADVYYYYLFFLFFVGINSMFENYLKTTSEGIKKKKHEKKINRSNDFVNKRYYHTVL